MITHEEKKTSWILKEAEKLSTEENSKIISKTSIVELNKDINTGVENKYIEIAEQNWENEKVYQKSILDAIYITIGILVFIALLYFVIYKLVPVDPPQKEVIPCNGPCADLGETKSQVWAKIGKPTEVKYSYTTELDSKNNLIKVLKEDDIWQPDVWNKSYWISFENDKVVDYSEQN